MFVNICEREPNDSKHFVHKVPASALIVVGKYQLKMHNNLTITIIQTTIWEGYFAYTAEHETSAAPRIHRFHKCLQA